LYESTILAQIRGGLTGALSDQLIGPAHIHEPVHCRSTSL
jgi:hypothetical protein